MESTSPPKYARDDPHITRMSMTRQAWEFVLVQATTCGRTPRAGGDAPRTPGTASAETTRVSSSSPQAKLTNEPLAKSVFGRA